MVERKTYGGPIDPRHAKMLDASFEATAQRTTDAKIERLRMRLKQTPIYADSALRAVLLGILDLLSDEL